MPKCWVTVIVIKIFKETFNFSVDQAVHKAILQDLVTPTLVNKPKTSSSLWSWQEMQNLRHHPRLLNQNPHFNLMLR